MITEPNASHGTVEGMKDKFVRDVKTVVADADNLLKQGAGSTVEELAAVRTKLEARLVEARGRLDDARIAVTEKVRGAAVATDGFVREHPWQVLGVAAAAGVIIGFFLSRR